MVSPFMSGNHDMVRVIPLTKESTSGQVNRVSISAFSITDGNSGNKALKNPAHYPPNFHPKISVSQMTQNSLKLILNTTFKKMTF